jgi:ABC-type proline/glycine betaine transport system permease subunit
LHFPADHGLAISTAQMIDRSISWMQSNFAIVFASFTASVRAIIEAIEAIFGWLPWPVPALLLIYAAWRSANIWTAAFSAIAVTYLGLFGFWDRAIATIALVGSSVLICTAAGLPLGILVAKSRLARHVLTPMMDVMQTLPTFVYLIPAVAFFSVGRTPAVIATVIFALSPMIRLTALGISTVPQSVVEAARAHGASAWQTLTKVELPLAANSVLLGINQTIMMSLSMVVIAAMIGAGGLGYDIMSALRNVQGGAGVLAGLAIVVCALVPDRIIQVAARRRERLYTSH